jgi:hypothetical protein
LIFCRKPIHVWSPTAALAFPNADRPKWRYFVLIAGYESTIAATSFSRADQHKSSLFLLAKGDFLFECDLLIRAHPELAV